MTEYHDGYYFSSLDANQIRRQSEGFGVLSGLDVSAASSFLGVTVSSGIARIGDVSNPLYGTLSSNTLLTLTADSTYPRRAIIYMNSASSITYTLGTASTATPYGKTGKEAKLPFAPELPTGSVLISEAWIPAGATGGVNLSLYNASKITTPGAGSSFSEDMISTYYPRVLFLNGLEVTNSLQGDMIRDTSTFVYGDASMLLSSTGGNLKTMTFTPTSPIDLQKGGIYLWMKPHGFDHIVYDGRYSASSVSDHLVENAYIKFYFDGLSDR